MKIANEDQSRDRELNRHLDSRYPVMSKKEESEHRIATAFAAVSQMSDEPALEVLKKLSHDFGLTSEEVETVIHLWVMA